MTIYAGQYPSELIKLVHLLFKEDSILKVLKSPQIQLLNIRISLEVKTLTILS